MGDLISPLSLGLRSIKLTILFAILPIFICKAQFQNPLDINIPKFTLSVIGEGWQNISIPTAPKKFGIYSKKGDDLSLNCEAPYPIKWNFTGYFSPPEIVKIQPPRRNLINKTFKIAIEIFFLDAAEFLGLGASIRIACEMIENPRIRDEIFVFVLGNNNQTLIQPKMRIVTDSKLIPCPTKDPAITPRLFHRPANGKEELIRNSSIRYHPTEGFRSTLGIFNGVYICRHNNLSVTINSLSNNPTVSLSDDYQFSPKSGQVRVFTEETIQFECFSNSRKPVKLIIKESDKTNLTVTEMTSGHISILQISPIPPEAGNSDYISLKGTVVCVTDFTKSPGNAVQLIKEWSYEFVQTPELYLDNFEGEVDCLSQISPKSVQTVRCKNGMDCDFMRHCLEDVNKCNFKKQKQFFGIKDTWCWIQKLDKGTDCASVPYSHWNGLAQCTVAGLNKQFEYFVSLELLKYSNWQEVTDQRELLRMDEVPAILYTNRTTQFFCMAVSYLFADSLSFEIEYKNGTRMLLENDGRSVNVSNPGQENPRKIDEFNVLGVLDINLSLDAVGVRCCALWWNRTDGLKTMRRFETRHLLKPKLTEEDTGGLLKREGFYIGDKHKRLTCFVKGEPQPEYIWYFGSVKVSEMFPELKTSLGSNGEGYLEFAEIGGGAKGKMDDGRKYVGEYKCRAENIVGHVERRFQVDVSDEPISGRSVAYIVTVVVILFILAFVMAMLFIYVRRYKVANELVRSLTDLEIEEFFQGKPELLENGNATNFEIVDFLPYKNEYEIPLSDLELDTSERNFLGTGEFSYVVRGKIISKSKPVAVKISKPSADVTLFKSFLSEVKIMIYIGEHENVVALIGVCTQGIRNRSIHIATEICDLGSLDGFLRKARPSFVNLVNANQEIDMSLQNGNSSPQHITTMDLISFSGQIAKGMEYLAFKSVIHADLAARNVLLTSNKIAKISDFGLSKKLYESNNYVKKSKTPLPWRWMAVESLTSLTFSTSSDIWAYGATLFEIFTLGDIPFPNEEWNKEFLNRLASGMRMGRPRYSTQEIYSKIVACWETEPDFRPNFSTLRVFFEQMFNHYTGSTSGGHSNNEPADINGPDFGHSGPMTTTGGSLYVNYDRNEELLLGNGNYVPPSSSSPVETHNLTLNQSLYANSQDEVEDEKQDNLGIAEMEAIPEKNVKGIEAPTPAVRHNAHAEPPNYINL